MTNIEEKIKSIVIRVMKLDVEPSAMDSENLIDKYGVTSVDALEILIFVESEFDIIIDDEDLNQSMVDSCSYLENYIIKIKESLPES